MAASAISGFPEFPATSKIAYDLASHSTRKRMRIQGCRGLNRRQLVEALTATPLTLSTPARAQLSATQHQFGVASIDPVYSAIYVAFKKGFFKDAGLTIDYLNSQSGPRTKQ